MPERWEDIKSLFEGALELDPLKRPSYLQNNADDPSVRAEVERLLAEYEEDKDFLSKPLLDAGAEKQEHHDLLPGKTIAGRFRIVRFIAVGGMGEVYEAEDLELRERVAIKTVPTRLLKPKALSDLRREVQLARKVTHPNVCRIFDLFREPGGSEQQQTLFVSMELLHGRTLAKGLDEGGALDVRTAAPLIRQLASGLIAAHEVGVIHGDLKPGNVFLVDARRPNERVRVVITDFGLAIPSLDFAPSSLATLSNLGNDGSIRGTLAYMAPEQLEGRRATVASDVYAFGVVIYEMMTGSRPFLDDKPPLLINAILNRRPATPSSLRSTISKHFDKIILKALEKDPLSRYRSADEVLKALESGVFNEQAANVDEPDQHEARDIEETAIAGIRKISPSPHGAGNIRLISTLVIGIALALVGMLGLLGYHRLFSGEQLGRTLVHARPILTFYLMAQRYQHGEPVGDPQMVSDEQPFSAGIGIQLVFRIEEPGYLYVFNEGPGSTVSNPVFNILFPSSPTTVGTGQLGHSQDVKIPSNGSLLFDNQRGAEKVWLIWSSQSLSDLESLTKWANPQDRGRVGDRSQAQNIKSFLSHSDAFSPQIGHDSTNRVTLSGATNVVVYLLNLNHV